MARVLEGNTRGNSKKIAIVVSRFNEFVSKRLLDACLAELRRCGIKDKVITVAWVPGSFEIPVTALKFARKKAVDAVICLGAVIRGETFHFELVAYGAAHGIMQAAIATGKPVIFGVLSTNNVQQAYQRSEKRGENKGRDAAQAALAMIDLLKKI